MTPERGAVYARTDMADRPLSEREREILFFLLSAPGLPDAEVFRRQAEVAICCGSCDCGCASINLKVEPSAAPQAHDPPREVVGASTVDIAGLHEREPLVFRGEDGHFDPAVQPTDNDLQGAIGLVLWIDDGWLSGIELWIVGDFRRPRTFPPAELFDPPPS
jgi:hypothetical protein